MENSDRKTSSSLKVGILTVVALTILIFTVLWIKGRTLSAGERIEVVFHDVNGIRPGSGVQMMGLRIGQIEEITPVINGKDSYVKVKFVITETGVEIPPASTISIQQSGLIGEQFLEVMPPKAKVAYVETSKPTTSIKEGQLIFMNIEDDIKPIGKIERAEVIPIAAAPIEYRARFKTAHALKLNYIIELPGLILDSLNIDAKFANNQILFYLRNGEEINIPKTGSPYTVIEPMRISDFLELQYKSAQGLAETNEKITQILSDEFIYQLKDSVENINKLTAKATSTMDKADALLDSSDYCRRRCCAPCYIFRPEPSLRVSMKLTAKKLSLTAQALCSPTACSSPKTLSRAKNILLWCSFTARASAATTTSRNCSTAPRFSPIPSIWSSSRRS